MSKYFTMYTSAELICLITALVCLFKTKELHWRLLIPFLLLITMVEFASIPLKALYRANPIPINSTVWLYNLLLPIQIGVFVAVFNGILKKYAAYSKVLILAGGGFLYLFYIYELLTNDAGIFNFNSTTYSAMSVLLVVYSLYYYYVLLKSEEYADLKSLPEFWWVTGTLFFFFGTTAFNLFYTYLLKSYTGNKLYLFYIRDLLIVILYGCWSYAFICKRWITSNK
ncbi:hypothetical protein ACFQZS_17920 [Mucilaginibacter calamicampi]|uniref:YhhN-like protein n=1 Tax=Mucilaginibacter calamicampi TaxID=1302352 RepID=A0ABW2Z2T8_9SPHI